MERESPGYASVKAPGRGIHIDWCIIFGTDLQLFRLYLRISYIVVYLALTNYYVAELLVLILFTAGIFQER